MELDQGIGADIARIKASLEVYRAKRKEQLVYMTQVAPMLLASQNLSWI